MSRPGHPSMGDALVTDYTSRKVAADTYAVIASCECGKATYTAVSFSEKSAKVLIYRKHRRHLPKRARQAELWVLDGKDMSQ